MRIITAGHGLIGKRRKGKKKKAKTKKKKLTDRQKRKKEHEKIVARNLKGFDEKWDANLKKREKK